MQITASHFFVLLFAAAFVPFYTMHAQFSIVVHPTGDARHTGRCMADGYERSYSSKIAHVVKKILQEEHAQNITISITHGVADVVEGLDNANRVNQAQPNLYIHIGCYPSTDQSLAINIYTPSLDPWYVADYLVTDKNGWIAYEDVYKRHKRLTDEYAKKILSFLRVQPNKYGFISDVIACPYAPLLGIDAPAIAIEVAIRNDFDCAIYARALADALINAIG